MKSYPVMWRSFYKTNVPKTNKSPIKDGSWKTILSFLDGLVSETMLVLGRF